MQIIRNDLKVVLPQRNARKRLKFAKENLNEPYLFWKSIIWSDESKFKLFGSDGKQIVWRKPHEALNNLCLKPTLKYGGGCIMIWICMSSAGVENFILSMELWTDLSIGKLKIADKFFFQEGNDPKHTSKLIQEYFIKNGIKRLETPPQSPDLKPIEHLWSEIKN